MKITLASHLGMCFGVRNAIQVARRIAESTPLTVLGELVHNPVVSRQLEDLGAQQARLQDPGLAPTRDVLITAHGASSSLKGHWRDAGHHVIDTTCPLVDKAHRALASLVQAGFHPVVVGVPNHTEVIGLVGDYPGASVVSSEQQVDSLAGFQRLGVISQTTQPLSLVEAVLARIHARFPEAEVKFIDTICQPTKNRQAALERLCRENSVIVVIGGSNSNNTRQLLLRARSLGCRACQVETAAGLEPSWFAGVASVGVTAGTSTLPETIAEVTNRLYEIAACGAGQLR